MNDGPPLRPSAEPRFRRRIPCSLRVDGREHRALVLNLSRGGLFVRTTARARPGSRIELDLPLEGVPKCVPLAGRVVWRRLSTSAVSQTNDGGFGLRLAEIPEAYAALVCALSGDEPHVAAQQPVAREPVRSFEVRLKQSTGPRSRWLRVDGLDEAAACTNALSSVGDDWEILEVRLAS